MKRIMIGYMLFYFLIMSALCGISDVVVRGEFDDYSIPVVSIIREGNFSISERDVEAYKMFFPELAKQTENLVFSGCIGRDGNELTWYFPTYSIACIPLVLLFLFLGLPASYGFIFTNLLLEMILLYAVFRYLKVNDKCKLLLILLLSINPIIFYYFWISAEVFLYAFLGLTMICWYNRWYKRAAIFVSLAGMLNPTIMSVGLIMIAEYIFLQLKNEKNRNLKTFLKELIAYGSCYIIGLIPMGYYLYHIGHINTTISDVGFVNGTESTWFRFWAYFFDWNYGIVPYEPLILVLAMALLIVAIWNRQWRYIIFIAAFLVNVFLYSIMTHINSGMSGIARYNAWSISILIFAVCLFLDNLIKRRRIYQIASILLYFNVFFVAVVVYYYGPVAANHTIPVTMNPIAQWVLHYCPVLYHPLPSTFYSRVNRIDGGYQYETPIVYKAEDGCVRKILVNVEDKEYLMEHLQCLSGEEEWLREQIEDIKKETYITVPYRKKIALIEKYELGVPMNFKQERKDLDTYILCGTDMFAPETEGTWTDGKELRLRFWVDSNAKYLQGSIDAGVFNGQQTVIIKVNDTNVYEGIFTGKNLNFSFVNPGAGKMIDLCVGLPDAVNVASLGFPSDNRELGLYLREIVFTELVE